MLRECCESIVARYAEDGIGLDDIDFEPAQIKEKFGTLRFYYGYTDAPCGIAAFDNLATGESIPRRGELIMRYYGFCFSLDESKLRSRMTSLKREIDMYYDNLFEGMTRYMYSKLENNVTFWVYRAEADKVYADFCFDDKMVAFDDAFGNICGMLNDTFAMRKILVEPKELTMEQYLDNLLESARRSYTNGRKGTFIDNSKLWIYDNYYISDKKSIHFKYDEMLIPKTASVCDQIYDEGFEKELANIESHANDKLCSGNLVHYVISSRSGQAAKDMAETLAQRLLKAHRLRSRRMPMVSEINPDIYKSNNSHFEDILDNNCGGAVVIDLTERAGENPAEYGKTCEYIEKMVKKYKNYCLFVFVYNIDKPGFAYTLLPEIRKYVSLVRLKEGTGDRNAAVKYMKGLIKGSEYAKYARQAAEFMEQFPGTKFTQTAVLNAYEQFESWCINKNIMKAYDFGSDDDFFLDRDENMASAYDRLQNMVGLKAVKEQIDEIIAEDVVEKERQRRQGSDYVTPTMHMIFAGNPGTAKTTVAKLFAQITKEKGVLKSGAFVEYKCNGIIGNGSVTLSEAFAMAKGGVLFIDEAYSMGSVITLLQEMENHRDEVIVILAGYNDKMRQFLGRNDGLKSRIPYWINFPDYDADELTEIFRNMLADRGFTATEDAVKKAHYIFDKKVNVDNFGNGRYVRNLLEDSIKRQSLRLMEANGDVAAVSQDDLFKIIEEDILDKNDITEPEPERESGTAMKELNSMIGLTSVKKVIRKAIANFKMSKRCIDMGMARDKASLHMVFTGNPGTAKTTVARLFAEILKDEKVLSTGRFVEVGRADLVGQYVGATAINVTEKFKEAKGGVLFIDEAYSLCEYHKGSFGDEAITTIVNEMENHRDDVIVIFAGYPAEMEEFLDRNSGLRSRIAFHIEFEDYTTDELCDITRLKVSNMGMTITDAAMEKLRGIYEEARKSTDFGNGRFVRKLLEEAEMNIAERLMDLDESELKPEMFTTIDAGDISKPELKKCKEKSTIGFTV